MDKRVQRNILDEVIRVSGNMQLIVAIEEMSELQKEITKHIRGKGNPEHIAEEIADVEIMLAQLKMIFNCDEQVQEEKFRKLIRLSERLSKGDIEKCSTTEHLF